MARRMRKRLSHAHPSQHATGGFVYIAAADACAHRSNCRLLGLQHGFVCISLFRLRVSQVNGAGHVGAITIEDYTEVESEKPSARQSGSGGMTMRHSGTNTGGNDGFKRHTLRAQQARAVLELGSDFYLWYAWLDDRQDVIEKAATDEGRFAHESQLFGVFHHAKRFDERRG